MRELVAMLKLKAGPFHSEKTVLRGRVEKETWSAQAMQGLGGHVKEFGLFHEHTRVSLKIFRQGADEVRFNRFLSPRETFPPEMF